MTCAHLSDKGTPCGRPAVAVWEHPVTGSWPLCARHHEAARQVIAASVFVGTDWVYEDAPLPDGPSAPVAA